MKKLIIGCFILSLVLTACEKKVTTTIDDDGDRTTVETVGLDRERIDSTAEKVGNKIEVAAKQTGDALETTGENIKEEINKADEKVKVQRKTSRTESETK